MSAIFAQPISINIETRNKIAEILKKQHQQGEYHAELKQIIAIDASAGTERTARTRFLASQADLVLTEMDFERFVAVELVKPFKENLRKKQSLMKIATQKFSHLLEYEVAEVTALQHFIWLKFTLISALLYWHPERPKI
ncbi:hypothetical protein [uncultured Desulfuromusa sp.]|uniref:hypothetical protein n=1 Tax=uncultured Desulfuromusa sp. TaxID=219183 RepID=UPI002AA64CD5|nr:hypothetical protein [uncultured Desulfuromusa sp.]